MNKIYFFLGILLGLVVQAKAQNAACGSCTQPGLDLTTNGNFSNSNAGFNSNLTFSAAGSSSPGKYAVRTQSSTFWIGGCTINDHTAGGGTGLLLIDGKTNGITIAWEQNISNLNANQDYIFSFYTKFSTCIASGLVPTIKILVNAVQVGDTFNINVGPWRKVSYLWNSGNATSAVLQIIDTVQGGPGNDFIIDDITFSACDAAFAIDAGTDQSVCAGTDVHINSTVTGSGTCLWSGPTGLDNVAICNPVFNSTLAGDYSYIVNYTGTGCSATDTVNIHVDALPPPPTISRYGDTIFSTFSTNYQWYSTSGIINGATDQFYIPGQSGYYTVHAIDPKGCESASDSLLFTICSQLITLDAGNDEVCCQGSQVNLNAISNGSGSCSWNGPSGLNNTNTCSPVFTAATAGIFTYIVTDTMQGCVATDQIDIQVNALPSQPLITRNGDTLFSTNGTNYQWYTFGTAINGETSDKIIPSVSGYYYVVVTNADGCSIASDSVLFLLCSQLLNIQTIADSSVCAGNIIWLSTTSSGQGSCNWSGPLGLDNYNICNPAFTQVVPGDYTFIVTDQLSGCTDTDTVTLHVDALPPQPVITQQNDSLISSLAAGYQWYFNSNLLTGETMQYLLPGQAGSFSVEAIDPKGCRSASDPFQYNPCSQIIQIHASSDTIICEGNSISLLATSNGSGNCSWSGSSGLDNYATCNPVFSPSATGYYTFVVTDTLSGCEASDTVNVTVSSYPLNPLVTISGDSLISNTADTYQWYNSGNAITGETNYWFLPQVAGYYYVIVTNTGGCGATADSVYFSPCNQLIQVETINDTVVCAGTPITLITTGNGPGNCVWNGPAGLDNYNTCQPVFTANTGGDYTFYVYDFLNGCEGIDSVNIHVNDLPVKPIITQQQDSLVASLAYSYQWYETGFPLWFENNYFMIPDHHAYYYVEITDQNGCTAVSDSLSPGFTLIEEPNTNEAIDVKYLAGSKEILVTNKFRKNELVTLSIYDIQGKIFNSITINIKPGIEIRINAAYETPGIYFIKVYTSKGVFVKKILINKP